LNLGDVQLLAPYTPGSVGVLVNDLTGILPMLNVVPSRAVVYSRANLTISTTYLIASIGGSHIAFGGVISGVDRAYRAGDLVQLQVCVNDTPGVFAAPAFTAFDIAGQASPLEVGATIAAGAKTFEWTTSNSSSVKPGSISIADTTGSVTLASGLANTGSDVITIGAITNTAAAGQVWTISGIDTQNAGFSLAYTVLWLWRVYAGTSANATLTANQIKALADSAGLQAGFAGTYSFSAGGYKYVAYPDEMGDVTAFLDATNPFLISMATASDNAAYSHVQSNGWAYALVSVTNANAVATSYRVFRTQYVLGGAISIRVT